MYALRLTSLVVAMTISFLFIDPSHGAQPATTCPADLAGSMHIVRGQVLPPTFDKHQPQTEGQRMIKMEPYMETMTMVRDIRTSCRIAVLSKNASCTVGQLVETKPVEFKKPDAAIVEKVDYFVMAETLICK